MINVVPVEEAQQLHIYFLIFHLIIENMICEKIFKDGDMSLKFS